MKPSASLKPTVMVIAFLGWFINIALVGSFLLAGFGSKGSLPEWIKDAVLVAMGALAGILAKTTVDHVVGDGAGPPVQAEIVNRRDNPVPTTEAP